MRRLGQHFLINKRKIRGIVEALELKDGDTVVEIGPGHGELTKELRTQNLKCRIIAIEKDKGLAKSLTEKFSKDENIEIVEGDALKALSRLIQNPEFRIKNYKIVGNIPYYITGYLFRILSELGNKPSLIILMIQKEVAERICALRQARGKPNMNLLAASVQFWAEPKIIGSVSKKNFRPMPKVDSAIIKLKPLITASGSSDKYYKFIKILFKQPRKTILNNLASGAKGGKHQALKGEIIKKLKEVGISPQSRPQNLNIKQIAELSTLF